MQWQRCGAPVSPALEYQVGIGGVVARSDRRGAVDPVADLEPGRVRPPRAPPADSPRPRPDRQLQQIVASAREDIDGITGDAGGDDIDDDLTGAEHGVGQSLDREWRSE